MFVVAAEEARTLDWRSMQTLLLVVEALGPSTAGRDRFGKRRRYQEAGVPLYWLVDPDERQVEIWTPADAFPRFGRERLRWEPAGAVRPFTLELGELFRPI